MKKEMTSFDVRAVVRELQFLVGGFLDKIYQEGEDFYLKFHVPGAGRREAYHQVGRWLALARPEEKPEVPEPFASALRRALPNPRVTAVEQLGFDRVVVLSMAQGEDSLRLILELFGRGNVALTRGDVVLQVFRPTVFKGRELRPGAHYVPPDPGLNPLTLDAQAFARHLGESKKPLVKALATDFSLGGVYAEELCLRAGVDKGTRAGALGDRERAAVHQALQEVVEDVEKGPAVLVLRDGRPVDALPARLQVYEGLVAQEHGSFSEALMAFVTLAGEEVVAEPEAIAKLRRRLEQQGEALRNLRAEEQAAGRAAEYLYTHYGEVEAALAGVSGGRGADGVISVDRGAGTVTIRGEGDQVLILSLGKDVRANADDFYLRRREAREKAARIEAALAETRGQLEAATRRAARGTAPRLTARPTHRFWFEAYRWFISGGGFLCLGGRDARGNDKLVKRHLREGDRYAHADFQGAPSVVVKEGSRAPEDTLREACHFSLLNSKAWSLGLATGSAYWVLPEQVSKRAESGEFVRTGSFVIRGKRNYFHDLPFEFAVGEIDHEGHRKIMGGPPSALVSKSQRYVILTPGRGRREAVVGQLARAFDVPPEEVSRILPPGGMDIRERVGPFPPDPGAPAAAAKG
jgi:predicted ribosome quality control (RQC) complex YloA/Tae2 family protein